MAHFAKVEDNIVRQVIVIRNENMLDENGNESETAGQAFIASIGLDGTWVQTSYNKTIRGKYAVIGDTWDGTNFVSPITE